MDKGIPQSRANPNAIREIRASKTCHERTLEIIVTKLGEMGTQKSSRLFRSASARKDIRRSLAVFALVRRDQRILALGAGLFAVLTRVCGV
jgi:hypothetical protein